MLKSASLSIPFLLIRFALCVLTGIGWYYVIVLTHSLLMNFVTPLLPSMFVFFLNPMGVIIGLGLGGYLTILVAKPVLYYFKLAHIIFITDHIISKDNENDKRSTFFKFNSALKEAKSNYAALAVNDFATQGLVKILASVLTNIKESIMNNDIMAKIKEPESMMGKGAVKALTKPLSNVLDMMDEIVVSYVWLTYHMLLCAREDRNEAKPNTAQEAKIRAGFMLESLTLAVRLFPKLMINSIAMEVFMFFVARGLAVVFSVILIILANQLWNIPFLYSCAIMVIMYKTLVDIVYYGLVDTIRVVTYLAIFYYEAGKLDALDMQQEAAALAMKVPGLKKLMKKAGLEVPEGEPTQGASLVDINLQEDFKEALAGIGLALALESEDYGSSSEEDYDLEPSSRYVTEQPTLSNQQSTNRQSEVSPPSDDDFSVGDEQIISSEDIQLGFDESDVSDPFSSDTWNR